jgi:hypothetical protein
LPWNRDYPAPTAPRSAVMAVGGLAFALEPHINRRRYWQILKPLRLDRTSSGGHFTAVLLSPASRTRADGTIAHYVRLVIWVAVREQLPISEVDEVTRYNHRRPWDGFVMFGSIPCGLVWHRRLLDDMKERPHSSGTPSEMLGALTSRVKGGPHAGRVPVGRSWDGSASHRSVVVPMSEAGEQLSGIGGRSS